MLVQALNEALKGLTFTPDPNSNVLNTDGIASMSLTVNDLGLSGEGGVQESETLVIHLVIDAVNDDPLLDMPDSIVAREDVPVWLSGISVSDIDSDEPGGEVLCFAPSWGRVYQYYCVKCRSFRTAKRVEHIGSVATQRLSFFGIVMIHVCHL